MTILQDIGSETSVLDEIARLRAENDRLKAQAASGLRLKVSEKGAISVYGMGRFPVTLYREQWERLFTAKDQIEDFILANCDKLSEKE